MLHHYFYMHDAHKFKEAKIVSNIWACSTHSSNLRKFKEPESLLSLVYRMLDCYISVMHELVLYEELTLYIVNFPGNSCA